MNWDDRPHRGRTLALLAGIFGGPPVAVLVYLTVVSSVMLPGWWGVGLLTAALMGVTGGVACVARLPEALPTRVVLAVLYVPAAFSGLMLLWALADGLSPSD